MAMSWGFGAWQAAAAQPARLHQVAGPATTTPRRAPAPAVGRYEYEGGAFILDRSAVNRIVLRFEGSPEVWVLTATSGPRGDIIYRNDAGRQVLRATRVGGLTVFTEARPMGAPCALLGTVEPFRLLPVPTATHLFQRLAQAALRASRAAQHLIEMEAEFSPESAALTADSGLVAAEAMVRLAGRPEGRAAIARVGRITIVDGQRPNAVLRAGVLTITVNASLGVAGRPSSDRILAAFLR